MTDHDQHPLTNSQVKRAGDRLRHALRASTLADITADPSLKDAWETLQRFQQAHVGPMGRLVTAASAVARAHGVPDPVPRPKRAGRIVEKIARESSSLSRLQDIGGCRIVVPDLDTQIRIVQELRRMAYELSSIDDYVHDEGVRVFGAPARGPRGSGYRAVHLIHRVEGRLIETQVRTEVQHAWATAVERAEQVTGEPMKFGQGPVILLDYFRVLSKVNALQDEGLPADTALVREVQDLGEQILEYYRRTDTP